MEDPLPITPPLLDPAVADGGLDLDDLTIEGVTGRLKVVQDRDRAPETEAAAGKLLYTAEQWRAFEKVATRKLDILDAATTLDDLRSPPGNRLELLKGDRAGQYSIRINDQWRICFDWTEQGPEHVEIVDYH